MDGSPEDRCGYTWLDDDDNDDVVGNYPSQQNCCWRKSIEESQYCLWHADTEDVSKSTDALQETRRRPEAHIKSSTGELLDGANLSGLDLRDLSLEGVTLRGSNLTDADLKYKDLTDTSLRGANLSDADLNGADLSDEDLNGADLSDANLNRANLSGAGLHGLNFSGAYLQETNLSGAQLSGANLSGTNLLGANISDAYLQGTDLSDAQLRGANLSDAYLQGANLSGASFGKSNHYASSSGSADLSDATLVDADLSETELNGVSLQRVDAEGADFSNANLTQASLVGADCEKADFRNTVLVRASLQNADLVHANLSGAYLFGTQLEGTRIDSETQLVSEGSVGEITVSEQCRYDIDAPPESPKESLAVNPEYIEENVDSAEVIQLRRARSVYRRLEELARQNGFSTLQSRMFKRRQEMRRYLLREQGQYKSWLFAELQRWVFVYGESFRRILSVSVLVVGVFWLLFSTTGIVWTADGTIVTVEAVADNPQLAWMTLYHSLSVFFSGVGPLSTTGTLGQIMTISLRATGPILLALLVFVLGRRAAR